VPALHSGRNRDRADGGVKVAQEWECDFEETGKILGTIRDERAPTDPNFCICCRLLNVEERIESLTVVMQELNAALEGTLKKLRKMLEAKK
jgi:hypothetical protein